MKKLIPTSFTSWSEAQIKQVGQAVIPIVTLLFILLTVIDPGFLEIWEQKTLDFRFWVRGQTTPDGKVVIVTIDEKSVQELGRWPWPREKMASLLNQVASGRPKVIAMDILFSEKETTSGKEALPEEISAGEEALKIAIREAGNVVLPVAFDVPASYQEKIKRLLGEMPDYLDNFPYARIKRMNQRDAVIQAIGVLPPLKPFTTEALALGHVYILPDRDGVLRREILWIKYQDNYYPPMSIQTARIYLGLNEMEMELRLGDGVRLGKTLIPTDEWGQMLINYHGREGTFPTYSATDLLKGRISPTLFQEKVVLIGASALATADVKITPFSNSMQGVEKNANIIDQILSQRFLYRTEGMKAIDIAVILLFNLILWRSLPHLQAFGGMALASLLLMAHIGLTVILFIKMGLWVYMFYPGLSIIGTFGSYSVYQYFAEEKKAKKIRAMFSSYVSPRIVEEMIKNPELAKLGGIRREVTILFSDIRGFTSFCERNPPAVVVEQLNEYLGTMTHVVFRWEGTLDKFVGDAIMVFWGAPLAQEDHAERAIRCALDMRKRLGELQMQWKAREREPLDIGVGINTGMVIVGNMGAEGKKMDYTVIGDPVNLAARVESLTRKYEVPLIITEDTYHQVKDLIEGPSAGGAPPLLPPNRRKLGRVTVERLDEVKVKGRDQSVAIYSVISIPREEEKTNGAHKMVPVHAVSKKMEGHLS